MQPSIRTLHMERLPNTYFTGNMPAQEHPDKPLRQMGITVIRTDDHFLSCRNAVSPHILDCYMICLVRGGEGVYHFGANSYYLGENTLCFIPPWTLTSWHSQTAWQQGFCCTFTEAWFNEGLENKSWLKNTGERGDTVLSLTTEQTAYFAVLLEDLLATHETAADLDLMRSQLHVLVRKIAALFSDQHKHIVPGSTAAIGLTRRFLDNCKADFERLLTGGIAGIPSLAAYAHRLHVTPNHLNDTVKAVTGRSVGQYLQQELSRYASALLQQTDLPIGQIADRLGFKDPAYFARFYRKHTGVSPSESRRQHP
ncbi:MAG: helix-turn-helix transcriptional regulator [Chitinophagaceae bacterium]|nr:helix-turn-helix transcriptional regulator [Chitinophagaceae bacterium]